MESQEIKKIYADWKKYDPDGYKRRIRKENIEAINIVLMIIFGSIFIFSVSLGSLCCKFVTFFAPVTKAVTKKIMKIDERVVYGEDLTGCKGEI